jgi:hypothetical protein
LTHLNALNGEIINLFRQVWARQAEADNSKDTRSSATTG